ncbi:hypothetical protein Tco_1535616 [Tanacetum coccineum]
MCTYLKNMEGYKVNDLKLKEFDSTQEMFNKAFKRVNTFEEFRTELVKGKEKRVGTELGDLKTMFEPHIEDAVWKNQQAYKVLDWKLYNSCKVHSLRMQHMQIYMLVEKKYPLAPLTLSMMLEKKLNIDYETGVSTAQRLQRKYVVFTTASTQLVLLVNISAADELQRKYAK